MRDAVVPAAKIVTPNQFELEFLTGHRRQRGRRAGCRRRCSGAVRTIVLVTSVVHDRGGAGHDRHDRRHRGGCLGGRDARCCRRSSRVPGTSRPPIFLAQLLRSDLRHRTGPHGRRRLRRAAGHSRLRWLPSCSWSPPRTRSPSRRQASRCASSAEPVTRPELTPSCRFPPCGGRRGRRSPIAAAFSRHVADNGRPRLRPGAEESVRRTRRASVGRRRQSRKTSMLAPSALSRLARSS